MRRRTISISVFLASALLTFGANAFDLKAVALKFLQRHSVPCTAITQTDNSTGTDFVVCEDGRVWALFWLENEVAFVDPQTRSFYRWRRDVFRSYPQLHGSNRVN